jgi:hypothetical protein
MDDNPEETAGRICQTAGQVSEDPFLGSALVELGNILRHGSHHYWNFPLNPDACAGVAGWLLQHVYQGTPVLADKDKAVTFYGYPFTPEVRQVFLRAASDLGAFN